MARFWIWAVAATAIGLAIAFVGVFAPLVGLVVSFFAYTLLMRSERTPETAAEPAMEIAEELS